MTYTDMPSIEDGSTYQDINEWALTNLSGVNKKKPISEMTQAEADTIFTLCTDNKWARENLEESRQSTSFKIDEDGGVDIDCQGNRISITKENIYGYEAYYYDGSDVPLNYAGIKYIMENFDVDFEGTTVTKRRELSTITPAEMTQLFRVCLPIEKRECKVSPFGEGVQAAIVWECSVSLYWSGLVEVKRSTFEEVNTPLEAYGYLNSIGMFMPAFHEYTPH